MSYTITSDPILLDDRGNTVSWNTAAQTYTYRAVPTREQIENLWGYVLTEAESTVERRHIDPDRFLNYSDSTGYIMIDRTEKKEEQPIVSFLKQITLV